MADVKSVKSGWFNLIRPWSLHGAVVPVVLGGLVAWKDQIIDWPVFFIVLICGCLLQIVANVLNTYGDFRKGIDTLENESRSPELVSGTLTPKSVLQVGILCIAIVSVCGLYFIFRLPETARLGMLFFGIIGIGGAAMYTVGASYKYLGLGQAGVFLLMGITMPIGTYYTMAGTFSYEPMLFGIPNAFSLTAVLAGNELRDYYEDKKSNVGTLSGKMSYNAAMNIYLIENALTIVSMFILVLLSILPLGCLISIISIIEYYFVYLNAKRAPTDPPSSRMLVPKSFSYNWHFGALIALGYLFSYQLW